MIERDQRISESVNLSQFADWPKLAACPSCEYDLTGLPLGHACPECGWGDGQYGVYLPAWSSRDAANRGWRATTYASLLVVGLLFTCGLAGLAGPWLALVLFVATMTLLVPIARLLSPASRTPDSRIIPTDSGLSICRGRDQPLFKQWSALRGVNVWSKHRRLHDLFLLPALDQPQPRLAERVVLDGSRKRAEQIAALPLKSNALAKWSHALLNHPKRCDSLVLQDSNSRVPAARS